MKLDIKCHIIEKLRMMRKNNVLCDLEVFSSDGIKQRVHSCVWVAAFEDCRTLLSNKYKGCENKTSKIELPNVNGDVLSTIVDFIYGEEINSIPIGLDGALKQLGFQGFRFYLDNGLLDYSCNQDSSLSSAEQPAEHTDTNLDLSASPKITSSADEVKVETDIVEDNPSLCSDTQIQEIPVRVKHEPVEISEPFSDENEELLHNIKIYSKQEDDDDQTVTVCVEYECTDKDEEMDASLEYVQATCQPSPRTEDETKTSGNKHEKNESSKKASQDNAPNLVPNTVHSSESSSVSVSNNSGSSHSSKNPPILPKFSSSQGDVVTVATFISFAELQKKGKSWKVQESLLPIPMSGNSTEAFNKLPIFPQSSQVKSVGEKRGRGRPKSCDTDTDYDKMPKIKKTSPVQARKCGSSAKTKSKGKMNTVTLASTSTVTDTSIKSSLTEPAQKGNSSNFTTTCASPIQHQVQPLTSTTKQSPVTSVPQTLITTEQSRIAMPIGLPSNSAQIVTQALISTGQSKLAVPTSLPSSSAPIVPQALISTGQSKIAIPTSLPSSSATVTIRPDQQRFGTVHTMIPCVDYFDSINLQVGCIGSVAPKVNPSIFVQPDHAASKTLQIKSMVNQVPNQAVIEETILNIPSNSTCITNGGSLKPMVSIVPTVISKSQSSVLKTVENAKLCNLQKRMIKNISAPTLPQNVLRLPQSMPTFLQSTPTFLQSTSTFQQSIPAFPQSMPTLLQSTPTLPQSMPTLLQSTPTLLQSTPTFQQTIPALPQSTPTLLQSTPTLLQSMPALPQNRPTPSQSMPTVNAQGGVAKYRDIKPKIKEPEMKTTNRENQVTAEKPMRKPSKHTRSLQIKKTLLNEPIEKYISDNIKRTQRYTPSSLKIKMNCLQTHRFQKRRKTPEKLAELYKKSGREEVLEAIEKSIQACRGQEKSRKPDKK